jgi:hypothetical protein
MIARGTHFAMAAMHWELGINKSKKDSLIYQKIQRDPK